MTDRIIQPAHLLQNQRAVNHSKEPIPLLEPMEHTVTAEDLPRYPHQAFQLYMALR